MLSHSGIKNTALFLILLLFFILFVSSGNNFYGMLAFLLLLFGSFFYGLYSKNPILSGLLGFLLPVIFLIFVYFEDGSAEVQRIFWYYCVLSFTGLFSGFLVSIRTENTNFNGICFLFSVAFVIIGLFHFLSGIN
ncbi:hypothetical protein MmiHf6_17310 [Methanimicrococcus hongohii]|uniref:Uncharacterized protein n=1 Tax=Methanimicrococcus hongohii TaxID=3028295 RepID=A0AA96V204_9EURY|nr:hypothetical protein MmiHf6_17310 [Methanimicrococcus sp. Hf6]